MQRSNAPTSAASGRPGLQGGSDQRGQPATQRKGWPFAEGSQNNLDETSAPWPRPSRLAAAKAQPPATPDQ